MCPPAVPGTKDGLSVKLPVSTAAASSNSTVNNTLLQDSVAYYIDVTLTSSIALALLFCIVLIIVFIIYKVLRSHSATHSRRLNNLASLTGHGAPLMDKETGDIQMREI